MNKSVSPLETSKGYVDSFSGDVVLGWAVNPKQPNEAASLLIVIDGQIAASIQCNLPRPDIAAHGMPHTNSGFRYVIPASFQDGLRHTLAVRFRNGVALSLPDD